jgi:hypothetical protein
MNKKKSGSTINKHRQYKIVFLCFGLLDPVLGIRADGLLGRRDGAIRGADHITGDLDIVIL